MTTYAHYFIGKRPTPNRASVYCSFPHYIFVISIAFKADVWSNKITNSVFLFRIGINQCGIVSRTWFNRNYCEWSHTLWSIAGCRSFTAGAREHFADGWLRFFSSSNKTSNSRSIYCERSACVSVKNFRRQRRRTAGEREAERKRRALERRADALSLSTLNISNIKV